MTTHTVKKSQGKTNRLAALSPIACAVALAIMMLFSALLLCSCAPAERHYAAEDYFLDLEIGSYLSTASENSAASNSQNASDTSSAASDAVHSCAMASENKDGTFKILQLTDIHIGSKDVQDKQFAFLDLVIQDADADFIVATGDLFTYADKATAKRLFAFLDSYGLPWTVTFGNHDEQCYFSIDWLTSYLNEFGSNCLFKDLQDDDVFGNANFVINLRNGGELFDQMIIMDSNRYCFGLDNGYDYFKQSQIDWYARMVETTAQNNGGTVLPSLLFYHIPLPETVDAWDAASSGAANSAYITGEKRVEICCPTINSGFWNTIENLGSTRAMFFGHDHENNFIVQYHNVLFAHGVTSTDRISADEDMMGGRVIMLHADHSLSFRDVYHTYDELDEQGGAE